MSVSALNPMYRPTHEYDQPWMPGEPRQPRQPVPTSRKKNIAWAWIAGVVGFLVLVVLIIGILVFVTLRPQPGTNAESVNEDLIKQLIEEQLNMIVQNLVNASLVRIEKSQENLCQDIQLQNSVFNNSIQQHLNMIRTILSQDLQLQSSAINNSVQQQLTSITTLSHELQQQISVFNNSVNAIQAEVKGLQQSFNASLSTSFNSLLCPDVSPPLNGRVVLTAGPNSLTRGLKSTAAYSCDDGYALVGQATRNCLDVFGGASTRGEWSEQEPYCKELITCPSLTSPNNGVITFTPGDGNSNIGLGSTATYSCNLGYVLEGQSTRTCGTSGSWTGAAPHCTEAVYCPSLLAPGNGSVVITSGVNYLSVGSLATYSCDNGFALLGDTTRNCLDQVQDSDSVGSWTGTQPYCQIILCPGLSPPVNGNIMLSTSGELGVGTMATYSCDDSFVLLGDTTRTCLDQDSDSVGSWTGTQPYCQIIFCPRLSPPANGSIVLSTSGELGVGSTATYSCDTGFIVVGEIVRTCQSPISGTTGTWTGNWETSCTLPNLSEIDCQDQVCRYQQLVCPQQDNCTVHCYDSREYACFQTDVFCPSGRGDCTINCDDSYACLQVNAICTQGDCTINCENDYSCLNSALTCSGDSCLVDCRRTETCSDSALTCSGDSCSVDCQGMDACSEIHIETTSNNTVIMCSNEYSCQHMNVESFDGSLNVYCEDRFSCYSSIIQCPPRNLCVINCIGNSHIFTCYSSVYNCPKNGSCIFNFHGTLFYGNIGNLATITCEENSNCSIACTGTSTDVERMCRESSITCPSESGYCNVQCNGGDQACYRITITCGPNDDCLNCSGYQSCQQATINCPADNNCTINCGGQYSCDGASITCPTGDYSCNILCTDPLSCSNLSITNTDNVFLQCCGELSCAGTTVTPASTECPNIIP